MPTCFKQHNCFRLKSLRSRSRIIYLLVALLCFQNNFYGQSLTGLWTGTISSDSTTIRKDQSFEIALTEYNGKVYGYSRSEFIVADTLYYILKRVKGTINGDICEVADDEIVSYNFRGKIDKGIKVTSTFRRDRTDNAWYLAGTWKTNATRKYYAVTGKVSLGEEKDLTASKIFPHLEELRLADEIAFFKESKEPFVAAIKLAKPEKVKTEYSSAGLTFGSSTQIVPEKKEFTRAEAVPEEVFVGGVTRKTGELPKTDISIENSNAQISPQKKELVRAEVVQDEPFVSGVTKNPNELPSTDKKTISSKVSIAPTKNEKSIALNKQPSTDERPVNTVPAAVELPKQKNIVAQNTSTQKPSNAVNTNVVVSQPAISTAAINTPAAPVVKEQKITDPKIEQKKIDDLTAAASVIGGRKTEFTQMVTFKADSIELALYDNGEVDGDTVSVYLNGEVILSRQGLKSTAIKKTIHITQANEDFTLVLFAENLGKYPPNTGLLVVHDGDDVYNLRFSSDLKNNAGIVFKRKK